MKSINDMKAAAAGELLREAAPKPVVVLKPGRSCMVPLTGYAFNPLRDWPRNEPCFCNSGAKAKKCCLPHQPACIIEADAVELSRVMSLGEPGRAGIRREYQRHKDEQDKTAREELANLNGVTPSTEEGKA